MKVKKISALVIGLVAAAFSAPSAFASYSNYGGSNIDFTLLSSAWTLGGGTRATGGAPAPGSATWSVMASGLGDVSGFDAHGGALTTALSTLYAGGLDEAAVIQQAINAWAAVSGFINLGQVADGGGGFGAAGVSGGVGNIRVGSVLIDGAVGSNVLAHAYQPGNELFFGAGGNIAGDVHFDNSNAWSDGGSASTIDFYTVALHELGHALGLGHSTVVGSVMEAVYGGPRRSLTADDIAGIQSIYGTPIPEPATNVLMMLGALAVVGVVRQRAARQRSGN